MVSGLDDLFITLVGFATCRTPLSMAFGRRSSPAHAAEAHRHPRAALARARKSSPACSSTTSPPSATKLPGSSPASTRTDPATRPPWPGVAARFRVHVVVCPHGGPTSKGDCLNWIYRGMQDYEARHGVRLRRHARCRGSDPSRIRSSWSTGSPPRTTWFRFPCCPSYAVPRMHPRPVLRRIRRIPIARTSRFVSVSAASCPGTESARASPAPRSSDWCEARRPHLRTGLHHRGLRKWFPAAGDGLPPGLRSGVPAGQTVPVATREYFPRHFRAAVRQRGRWVTGIALQGWERHGWRAGKSTGSGATARGFSETCSPPRRTCVLVRRRQLLLEAGGRWRVAVPQQCSALAATHFTRRRSAYCLSRRPS